MILLILLLALILRLINIDQSLWLDEAINVNAVKSISFSDLIFKYSIGDFHPPLYHILLKSWIALLPPTEIAVRLLSVFFGVATVLITFLIGKKLFEKKTAIIAATLIATAPLHVYYSQESRMYALAAFLATLSVFFFISILKKVNILYLFGFIVSSALMLYADYLPYLLIPTYILYLLINRKSLKKSAIKSFIPAFILIFLAVIPWLTVFPQQFSTGLSAAAASPAWAQVVGSPNIANMAITFVKFTIGRISNNDNLIYALTFTPAALFVAFMFLLSLFRSSAKRIFLWYWFFTPLILAFAVAFFVPIFAYFRFIFILPAFYLIWASAINTVNIKKPLRILLISALLINLISLSIYYLNPKFHRENWKSATKYVHDSATANSIVLFEAPYSMAPFEYYNENKIEVAGALSSFSAKRPKVSENVSNLTKNKNQVFLYQYLSGITDPTGILFEEITNAGFKNVSTKDFSGVGFVYEFKR